MYEEAKEIELDHYFHIGEIGYLIHAQWIKQYVSYLENERIKYPKPPIDTSEFGEECINKGMSEDEILKSELALLDRIIDKKLLTKDGKSDLEFLTDYDSLEPLNHLVSQNPEAKVNNAKDIFLIHDVLLDPQMVPDARSTYTIVSSHFEEFIKTRSYESPLTKPFSIPRMCVKDSGIKVKFEIKPAKFQINFLPTPKIFSSPSKILKFMIQISRYHSIRMLKYRLLSLINSKLSLNLILRQFQIHNKPSDPYMEIKSKINAESRNINGISMTKFQPNSIRLWILCEKNKPSLNTVKDFNLSFERNLDELECEKKENEEDKNAKYFIESDYSLYDGVFNSPQFKPNGICLEHFSDVQIDHLLEYLKSDESQRKCIYVEVSDAAGNFMFDYEHCDPYKSGRCLECCNIGVLIAHDKATSQSFCSEICMNSFNS